ncbi:phospholipid-transporting ATPase ABCA3-like isoform X2 [Ochotona curzoniae]|nr:phospholipid-transporting ATPase ABCA3-like isoform X2 [Ochotona curzoniae]
MKLLTLNQFAVLLWKNFTIKRRHWTTLILEIFSGLVFALMLLVFRALTEAKTKGPYNYTSQPISTLPAFIKNAKNWELVYVPSNISVVKEITENVKRNLNISIRVRGFSSETEFEKYIQYDYSSHYALAAIVFDHDFKSKDDSLPLQVKYHLRFARVQRTLWWPDRIGWKTGFLFPNRPSVGPRNPSQSDGGSPGYIKEGFMVIQYALDKAIMLYHENNTGQKLFDGISIFIQRFPYPAYCHDGLLKIIGSFLPLIFILIFSPIVLSNVRYIVWEKEKRLKEYQLITGLKSWMIWVAYFLTFFFWYIIIISFLCMLFFIFNRPVFRYSDTSFIFLFLMCYAVAAIFFGFMISTFFNKVPLAASAGNILFFASFFPFNFIIQHYGEITLAYKVVACLSSNVALALGINLLFKLETKEIGAKWRNFWTPAILEDNLVFGYLVGMLLLDAFLYGLVAWYLESVFPGQNGLPQPWYFFFMRSYWCGKPRINKNKEISDHAEIQSRFFEDEPISLVTGIQIKRLHKEFDDNTAVNNLSLNVYKDQITILLGHNGAGKTTVLSILTGRFPPTRGKAYINGCDISDNIIEIRKNLGFCPQHDLLFNDLTVTEHLFFYSVLKGVPQRIYSMEIAHMLSIFNLLEKRDDFPRTLSGGMKRKLSIIIAFIGGAKVVILDEPSSGMDPTSRRVTWHLLQRYKYNRTILMTTQFMDEADILGDRIAIMVMGTLHCCGSSVFLKQIYGAGYHIVLQKGPHCDVQKISAVIRSHVPNAAMENDNEDELSFILPRAYTTRFEGLFNELEVKQKDLGIASFSASVTTMEDVYVKVNKLATSELKVRALNSLYLKAQNIKQNQNQNMNIPRTSERTVTFNLHDTAAIKFNTGFPLYLQQFYSMFIKRALFSWRNWKFMLLQLIVILVVTSYLLLSLEVGSVHSREIDLSQYGRTTVPYSLSGNSDLALKLIKNLEIFLHAKNQQLKKVPGNVKDFIIQTNECRELCIIALSIEVEENNIVLTVLFNNEAYHSAPTSLAVLDNVLFMSLSGFNASIRVSNKPQPLPIYGSNMVPTNGLQIVLCLAFGISVVVGNFCLQTVNERISKTKHIQFVSGVYVLAYWLSALLWDLISFFISCCLLLVIFVLCDVDAFVVDYHFLDTVLIFMLYGWCVVPFIYLGSFLFSSSTTAYIKITLFNYFSTVFSIIIHTVIKNHETEFSNPTKNLVSRVLMVLPTYNFAMSISRLFDDYEVKKLCAKPFRNVYLDCSEPFLQNDVYNFGEHGIAKFLITLAVMGLFFLLLLLLLETVLWSLKSCIFYYIVSDVYRKIIKRKATVSNEVTEHYEDENVKNERNKALNMLQISQKAPLLIKELGKVYFKCPVVQAVRNISLVVKKSECFGIFGLSGAGKTTTFKMLTGDETVTSGVVLIDGISIIEHIRKVRSRIGYCPQPDSMLNHMTGRELLVMYARLWGVPEPDICKYVEAFLHSVSLDAYADKFVYTYSGGHKRRLNAVIALMGKSSVVFLDEPSTGMDPIARHLLWDTIKWICKTGKAIILTSHSMEECEALCTRLAIMAKGRFTYLGSPRHLRIKYGNICILTAKINIDKNEEKLQMFKNFIENTFPGNIINQEYQGTIFCHIPSEEICWGKVFRVLEEAKVLFSLQDYSISKITLEEIFLTYADIDQMQDDHNRSTVTCSSSQ